LLPAGVPRHLADPVEHCALYRVAADWRDTWLTFCRELRLKHEADQDIALDLAED
ncbi:hypothetical protein, partial [Bordetella pertussis]|uniref:hypothetical protein n=1 Tax=Bordetella pertussis TaxID=520 RepID=UPI0021CB23DC